MEATKEDPKTVVEYLDRLQWDGTPRLTTWLRDYAGADDTSTSRVASSAVLVGAVRRARHPGCKIAQMLVLEGRQGSGKSEALHILAGAWFSELSATAIANKQDLSPAWIVELSDLQHATSPLKACLDRQVDEFRKLYGRESVQQPRAYLFVGTSNNFHVSMTAARRFCSVQVTGFELDRLRANRDQLWAEACLAEASGSSTEFWLEVERQPHSSSELLASYVAPTPETSTQIHVAGGKYTFVISTNALDVKILRYGEAWHAQVEGSNAITSMMHELDAARVLLDAARKLGAAAPLEIKQALERHDRLVDDHEPPSAWAAEPPAYKHVP